MTRSPEHARIEALLGRLSSSDAWLVPNGDDCAVLRTDARPVAMSVDASVEGVHFRRSFASLQVLAHRAAVASLSDLAAMGARPAALLAALVLPRDLSDEELEQLMAGIEGAAVEVGATVAGGNLSAGPNLAMTFTALGHQEGAPLTRGGARPGDGVFVTAHPGHAALGLEYLLRGGGPPSAQRYLDAWLRPRAHVREGLALVGRASACIDVSDGLAQDLGHVCRASGVGATLELPADPDLHRHATELGVDGAALRLRGGESYGLLFTAADDCGLGAERVGRIDEAPGVRFRDSSGEHSLSIQGFDHFADGMKASE